VSQRLFEQRRRAGRWQRWRWRVLGLLVVVLLGAGAYVVWFSDVLGVRDVEVRGVTTLEPAQVLAVAKVPTGEPLARLDTAAVERRVAERLPRVATVDVRRDWPHGVVVDVTERVAVVWTRDDGKVRALDAEGVAFRTYARAPKDLLEVTSSATGERRRRQAVTAAAQVLADVRRRAPELYQDVRSVRADTRDDVRLQLRGGRTLVWGSPDQSTAKLRVVDRLLDLRAKVYDVSAPDTPTTS
jgi:cell division protein FtsQ